MAEILAMKRETADELVSPALKDGILRLTFSSPPANALSLALMAALQEAFDRARDDKIGACHRAGGCRKAVFGRP